MAVAAAHDAFDQVFAALDLAVLDLGLGNG
jgi:hypothetical protein